MGLRMVAMALALALAGCGTPESECRDGVAEMKRRTEKLVGMDQPDDIKRALEHVSAAETQLATGNHAGCLESLDQSRTLLNRGMRQNQQ